ncbi:uncharacterized protein LOC144477874, partial [Augochlora pura]
MMQGTFSIDMFDPASTNWKRWLQRFEGSIKVFQVPDDEKVAYLLHYIGTTAFDMICDKLAPEDPYNELYNNLTAKLEEFYSPKALEIAENYRFHLRKQSDGEGVQTYVAALHKLSINYNFGNYLKTALRNQFVFGLASKRAQARLLETKDLDFEKAIQIAASMELSEKDAMQLQSGIANVDFNRAVQTHGSTRHRKYVSLAKAAWKKADAQPRPVPSRLPQKQYRSQTNIACF